jgi:hypothetical protein
MGYMGFGMRKEDYTRKPKESFKTIKRIYGDNLDIPKVGVDEQQGGVVTNTKRHRFTHFFETTLYKLVMLLVAVVVGSVVLWTFLIKDLYKKHLTNEFEQSGIIEYYKQNEKTLSLIKRYLQNADGKIISMSYKDWNDRISLVLCNRNQNSASLDSTIERFSYDGFHNEESNKDKVDNGKLVLEDGHIKEHWIYDLDYVLISQVDKSFIDYLGVSQKEMKNTLIALRNRNLDAEINEGTVSITFEHPEFETYEILYTDKLPKASVTEEDGYETITRSGRIAEGIYWTKTYQSKKRRNLF